MELSEEQKEIENYRAKCEALKSTWLAANQNFLYFQKMAHEDLEKAKTVMTKSQLETWENLRKRDATYEKRRDSYRIYAHGEGLEIPENESPLEEVSSKFKLVKKSEIDELKSRLSEINEEIKKKEENCSKQSAEKIEKLEDSIENLYSLLHFENGEYERELEEYTEIETNFRDLEEAVKDRVEELSSEFNATEKFRQLQEYDEIIYKNRSCLLERLDKIRESRKSQKREIENARKEQKLGEAARREFESIPEASVDYLNDSHAMQRLQIVLATEVSSREKLEKIFLDDRIGIEENINMMLINAHEQEANNKKKLHELEQLVAKERQHYESESIERSWQQENLEKLKKDYLEKKKEKEIRIRNLTAAIHFYKK